MASAAFLPPLYPLYPEEAAQIRPPEAPHCVMIAGKKASPRSSRPPEPPRPWPDLSDSRLREGDVIRCSAQTRLPAGWSRDNLQHAAAASIRQKDKQETDSKPLPPPPPCAHAPPRKPRASPAPPPPPPVGEWDKYCPPDKWDDLVNSASTGPSTRLSLSSQAKHTCTKLVGSPKHRDYREKCSADRSSDAALGKTHKPVTALQESVAPELCFEERQVDDVEGDYIEPGPLLFGPWPPQLEVPSRAGSLSAPSRSDSRVLLGRSRSVPSLCMSSSSTSEKEAPRNGVRCIVSRPRLACQTIATPRSVSPWHRSSQQCRRVAPAVGLARIRV
jgi:hypothetical protein